MNAEPESHRAGIPPSRADRRTSLAVAFHAGRREPAGYQAQLGQPLIPSKHRDVQPRDQAHDRGLIDPTGGRGRSEGRRSPHRWPRSQPRRNAAASGNPGPARETTTEPTSVGGVQDLRLADEDPRWSALTALLVSSVVTVVLLGVIVVLLQLLNSSSQGANTEIALSFVFVVAVVVLIYAVCTLTIVLKRLRSLG